MKNVYAIACAVINRKGKLLLLKRSPDKELFPNKWFVVGAYPMTEDEDFEKKTHTELIEETGLDAVIVNRGQFCREEGNIKIIINTFLAKRNSDKVKLNSEHTEYKWISLSEIKNFDTVEGTFEIVTALIKNE